MEKIVHNYFERNWRARVCEMADLLGHSRKLECFDVIGIHGKCNLENKFLGMVFQLLEEITIY